VAGAIEACVPEAERVALIDQDELGIAEELRGRRVVQFPQANGVFAGPPGDDGEALAELERLRAGGVRYVALAWPAFWWLEEYPRLADALRAGQRVLADTPDALVLGPAEA
jgi:hypothetical protein